MTDPAGSDLGRQTIASHANGLFGGVICLHGCTGAQRFQTMLKHCRPWLSEQSLPVAKWSAAANPGLTENERHNLKEGLVLCVPVSHILASMEYVDAAEASGTTKGVSTGVRGVATLPVARW